MKKTQLWTVICTQGNMLALNGISGQFALFYKRDLAVSFANELTEQGVASICIKCTVSYTIPRKGPKK